MNRKARLLTLVVVVVLATTVVVAAFFMQTVGVTNGSIRVACVGDSLTAGTGYPLDLWALLGSNYVVGNLGVGGTTVSLTSNSSYMDQAAFQVAEHFEPNIVIIMLGTNDANVNYSETNANFVNDYVQLIKVFESLASKPKIWIVEPPPVFNNSAGISPQLYNESVLPNIKAVAAQTHLPTIDANTPLIHRPNFFEDGVHPNSDGAAVIAFTIYRAILGIHKNN